MLKSQKGYSLVEIMVAVSLLSIAAVVFVQQTSNQNDVSISAKRTTALVDLIEQNIFAVKSEKTSNFPEHGKCFKKIYDSNMALESESESTECGGNEVHIDKKLIIYIHYRNYEDITPSFSPAATLKLPKYSKDLYLVDIIGLAKSNKYVIKKEVSLFKK